MRSLHRVLVDGCREAFICRLSITFVSAAVNTGILSDPCLSLGGEDLHARAGTFLGILKV